MALKLYSFHYGKSQFEGRKSEVLVEMEINVVIFWVVAPYDMVRGYLSVFRVDT